MNVVHSVVLTAHKLRQVLVNRVQMTTRPMLPQDYFVQRFCRRVLIQARANAGPIEVPHDIVDASAFLRWSPGPTKGCPGRVH